jgi:hypothetical protein
VWSVCGRKKEGESKKTKPTRKGRKGRQEEAKGGVEVGDVKGVESKGSQEAGRRLDV